MLANRPRNTRSFWGRAAHSIRSRLSGVAEQQRRERLLREEDLMSGRHVRTCQAAPGEEGSSGAPKALDILRDDTISGESAAKPLLKSDD